MDSNITFGSGRVFLHDGTNTPREVGILKDVSVEISSTQKELRGNKRFPVAVATSAQKISAKASSGTFDGALIASILGATVTTGSKKVVTEVKTAAASVTVAEAATFQDDLGVLDATGKAMTRVAATPAAGQYAVNETTGVYTFNAAEAGSLSITYRYTLTTGSTATVTNATQAAATTYKVVLSNEWNGSKSLTLFAAVIPKLSIAMKAEEFTESAVDIEAYADSSGNVVEITY